MNRYASIMFSAMFLIMTFSPCQLLAASITETKAAIGKDCVASGDYSTAMGYRSTASGVSSTAMGDSTASGDHSTAMGYDSTASGVNSTAMGYYSTASGYASTAMGYDSTASGDSSTAMGYDSTASGLASTAMGGSTASGDYSTAMGSRTTAGGDYSWAGGMYMQLTDAAENTFVWGHSSSPQPISMANAFLIFPTGTQGKVGIGTKDPNRIMHIVGSNPRILIEASSSSAEVNFKNSGDANNLIWAIYKDSVDNNFNFYQGENRVTIQSATGNVGIGTTSPSYKLHVNGTAAGTSWTNLSSREYKENICKVDVTAHPMMLAKLMNMDITTYNYKKEYGGEGDTKLGFIAEDLPEEVLSKNGKGVDLYELLTLTIGAMKAQNKEIEVQKLENRTLKAKVSELFKRIDALEK